MNAVLKRRISYDRHRQPAFGAGGGSRRRQAVLFGMRVCASLPQTTRWSQLQCCTGTVLRRRSSSYAPGVLFEERQQNRELDV